MSSPSGSVSPRSLLGLALLLAVIWGATQALSWWQSERAAQAMREGSRTATLTLYTTSTCPYCARAADWLNGHGVTWRECNIERDPVCLRTYEQQGSPGVPLVEVNGLWNLGFNPAWVAAAFEKGRTSRAQADRPRSSSAPLP